MRNTTLIFALLLHVACWGQQPKNIIFIVGDGMGVAHISAAMAVADNTLVFDKFKHLGYSKTQSADNFVTDSAAGATAFATGNKTNNGYLSVTPDNKPVKTILEIAEEHGLSTGLVATSSITHATPAAFIAHVNDRDKHEEIAKQFLNTEIDVFIGGGKKYFEANNLIDSLVKKGYNIATNIDELEQLQGHDKIAGLLAPKHLPRINAGRGNMLEKASMLAINTLDKNNKGFFLMIESSQIDWGGHANSLNYIVSETIDLSNTIEKVLEFANTDGETLVIVTADHETGGLTLDGWDEKKDSLDAKFSSRHHTGIMVPVFAYGPGAELFTGIFDNTKFFTKFLEAYNISE